MRHKQLSFPFAYDLPVTPRWRPLARRLVKLLYIHEQDNPMKGPPAAKRLARDLHVSDLYFRATKQYGQSLGWVATQKRKLYTTELGREVCL